MPQAQINTLFEQQQRIVQELSIIRDIVERLAHAQQVQPKPEMTRDEALDVLMGKLRESEESIANEGWMTVEESMALLGLAPV